MFAKLEMILLVALSSLSMIWTEVNGDCFEDKGIVVPSAVDQVTFIMRKTNLGGFETAFFDRYDRDTGNFQTTFINGNYKADPKTYYKYKNSQQYYMRVAGGQTDKITFLAYGNNAIVGKYLVYVICTDTQIRYFILTEFGGGANFVDQLYNTYIKPLLGY